MSYDPTRHAYMRKLMRMLQDGMLPASGVSEVNVRHGRSCAILAGGQYCDCDPDVELLRPPDPAGRRTPCS